MPTAEELTLAIQAEGVGETQSQLEGVEQSMEETAESAGESAEQLEGFSERFAGAMSAAVAALAVGAAGLLSQVPVIGEAFGGLSAVVSAVAFQMDKVLRPVLAPLTRWLYKASQAVFNMDGALGTVVGVVASVASALGVLAGAAASVGAVVPGLSAFGALSTVFSALAGAVATVAGAIAGLPIAVGVAIAAIVAFATAYLFNLGGVRTKTNEIIGDIVGFFTGLANDLVNWASGVAGDAWDWGVGIIEGLLGGLKSLVGNVVDGFTGLASGLADWAGNLADQAMSWGKSVIRNFIEGMKDVISGASDFLGEISSSVGINIPTGADLPDLGGGGGGSTGAGSGGSGFGNRTFFRGSSTGSGGTTLDGRQLTESTGRYRADPSRRQGL